jgi:segregation and condensation protein A
MNEADYLIEVPSFTGPLDLLLHLIERQQLDITTISLFRVTEQYMAHIEKLGEDRVDQMVDFLSMATRLLLIKSRALLPTNPASISLEEEEEDPAEALVRQLRQYKQFKESANWLGAREASGLRTFLRVAPPPKLAGKLDLADITVGSLIAAMRTALARASERDESVSLARPRRITMEGQIGRLRHRLRNGKVALFEELLPQRANRVELAITLLAVLELIKLREISARQSTLFGPIEIRSNLGNGAGAPA